MDNKILRAAFLIYGHLFTGYGFWRSKTLRAFKNVTHEPAWKWLFIYLLLCKCILLISRISEDIFVLSNLLSTIAGFYRTFLANHSVRVSYVRTSSLFFWKKFNLLYATYVLLSYQLVEGVYFSTKINRYRSNFTATLASVWDFKRRAVHIYRLLAKAGRAE